MLESSKNPGPAFRPKLESARLRFVENLLIGFFKLINVFCPWHKLPKYLGLVNLYAFRVVLRRKNLYDTDAPMTPGAGSCPCHDPKSALPLYSRTPSGERNDLQYPLMGCAGARFGRNVPREKTKPDLKNLFEPDPREISERLLARQIIINENDEPIVREKPAESLNLLAAAWIQFQVHDWFNHAQDENAEPYDITMGPNWPGGKMKLRRSKADPARPHDPEDIPAYANEESHWWDASQVYGVSSEATAKLRENRTGCKLELKKWNGSAEEFLPLDDQEMPLTGFSNNWWLGIELLHTLFAKEHNAICEGLRIESPHASEDDIFETAHLINAALIAKIHTIEWTPAILGHPVIQLALDANWWGVLGERIRRALGHFGGGEDMFSGIPGSQTDHHAAPYSLTEEFTAVYRLHPLIPEGADFFRVSDGDRAGRLKMDEIAFQKARTPFRKFELTFADIFYSFGLNHPGAITLRNYPTFLRQVILPGRVINGVKEPDRTVDVATIDILRDRERGVPRYNEFRRLLHRGEVKSFEELVGAKNDPARQELADEMRRIYKGDLEMVDLMVGMFAEPLPEGFAFSDTAFRIFILMASRRLKSDRFLTTDFRPEVYTEFGIDWIQKNTMRDILIRHHSPLRAALRNVNNAFAPWNDVSMPAL